MIYFSNDYISNQNHQNLYRFDDDALTLLAETESSHAISIPKSPFGSFLFKDPESTDLFPDRLGKIKNELRSNGIEQLEVRHPSPIYNGFPALETLKANGFEVLFEDVNQHIELENDWEGKVHKMQQRKLASLKEEGFAFKKMDVHELETAYKFLEVCRVAQGLQINIEFDLLKNLVNDTGAYDIFGVFREGKISALCICVRVTNEIAYYYLPATSPMFRNQSPMVLLIYGMVDYYRREGLRFFDLGITSIQGKPQESLMVFKERMGAVVTKKPTLRLEL